MRFRAWVVVPLQGAAAARLGARALVPLQGAAAVCAWELVPLLCAAAVCAWELGCRVLVLLQAPLLGLCRWRVPA